MKRKYIKQNKKLYKKNKLTLLKDIFKNLERDYLSHAFNIWAVPEYKDENENIFVNYQIDFQPNSENNLDYINGQDEVIKREKNYNSNNDRQEADCKNHNEKYLIELGYNSIKRKTENENENNLKVREESLISNKEEKIYEEKGNKRNKINRNNIPILCNIKLSNIRKKRNYFSNGIKSKKTNRKKRNDFSLLTLTDEEEKNFNDDISNDNGNDNGNYSEIKESNDKQNKKEVNFIINKKRNLRNIFKQEKKRNKEMNSKLLKSADFTRKKEIKKIKEKKELYIKNLTDDENDSKKENEKDLTILTKLINNINNKSKYLTRLYFDRWYQYTINYKNDEDISLTEINNETLIDNLDNIIQNHKIINEENKRKHNITKKQKKFFEYNITPLGEQNKIYENFNNFLSYNKEIKAYNSKNFIKPKNIFAINEDEYNLIFSKEKPLETDSDENEKHHKNNQKTKKIKKNIKKYNLINVIPSEDSKYQKVELDENKKNSKSIDNLGKLYDLPSNFKSNFLQHKLGIQNSFVNKYFKSRIINYSKEDINPDVINIQIRQEKETESEKIINNTKIFKKGFHKLRKVIRSFQKRKNKGNSKDILKIYINKWMRIVKQFPVDFYNDSIYSNNRGREDISPKNIIHEYNNNNNYEINYDKNYFIKNINNNKNLDEETHIDFHKKKKIINNSLDSNEDLNNNKIISKSIEVIKRERNSRFKKNNNNLNKNKSRINKAHKFDLSNSYDRIIKKEIKKNNQKKIENLKKFYNLIKKINKKNEQKLIYKYFIHWFDLSFNSFEYIPYHNKYKSKKNRYIKNSNKNLSDEINITKEDEDEKRLSIRDIKITEFKSKNMNKIQNKNKKISNSKYNDRQKKEYEKYNNTFYELKEEIKKSIIINNNILKLMNESRSLSSISNYLKFIKSQNKLYEASQIYYCYNKFNENYYIKLKRNIFYKWLRNNRIFKHSIHQENHIKSKSNYCINYNYNNIKDINCIDSNFTKIKNSLKKILIRHLFMRKVNLKKYYLYLWYKKAFKIIRKIKI